MAYTRKAIHRLIALAGLAVLSAMSSAFIIDDAKILIDRALNSTTLTVRYSGAAAATAELRINGISLGTRSLDAAKKNGETNFNLDLATLADGENDVEVRLFDKNGKLVGTQKTTILSDDPDRSPVRLTNPKMGASVMGSLEIKVGFGRELRNSYVSFFVNNQFRSMTNSAPYSFIWDTTREPNGWHELEAWVVDENSTTLKTRKTRVFVNNPSGQTPRRELPVEVPKPVVVPPTTVTNPIKSATTAGSGLKSATTVPSAVANAIPAVTPPKLGGVPTPNEVKASVGTANGIKPTKVQGGATAGAKLVVPTLSKPKPAVVKPAVDTPKPRMEIKVSAPKVTAVTPALTMLSVNKGTKIGKTGTYSITLNSTPVTFDVQPWVEDGVPLAPIRHLLEHAGGEVNWQNDSKTMTAFVEGRSIFVKIGDRIAKINELPVELEMTPFIERGRTIVPLSFVKDTLDVEIQYDPKTGHVLITSTKK